MNENSGEPYDTGEPGSPRRRSLLSALAIGGAGTLAGAGAATAVASTVSLADTPASADSVPAGPPWRPPSGHLDITWAVNTSEKLVALTFDDGPAPKWTPQVLDTLEEEKAKATFFVVGNKLVRNAKLVHGRLDRHEVGSHTWSHRDLSRLGYAETYEEMRRAHQAIERITGKAPQLMRPPYGRLGGTALQAAANLGYDMVMWSVKMPERAYLGNPPGVVDYIVEQTQPGTILLAHDTGKQRRLVTIRNLGPMIRSLRAKGFEFVTVSELRGADQPSQASHAKKPR